jgi:hypothetical protein
VNAPAFDARVMFVDSDSASDDVGVRFRRTPSGPELDLVESFLGTIPLRIPSGCRATIFREPRLESGFPDVVVVVWREEVARNWRSERGFLEAHDLRIMHYLYQTRRTLAEELFARFGRRATRGIERLQDAAMIRAVGSSWSPVALRCSYAALNITAIEAKVGKWSEVLNQALLNTWFASESYVLVPNMPSQQQIADAQRLGIGICSLYSGRLPKVASGFTRVPRSYASWMLNDWAWRFAQRVSAGIE